MLKCQLYIYSRHQKKLPVLQNGTDGFVVENGKRTDTKRIAHGYRKERPVPFCFPFRSVYFLLVRSVPFHFVPFRSIPFHCVPFRFIAFHSVPFRFIAFHSVQRVLQLKFSHSRYKNCSRIFDATLSATRTNHDVSLRVERAAEEADE